MEGRRRVGGLGELGKNGERGRGRGKGTFGEGEVIVAAEFAVGHFIWVDCVVEVVKQQKIEVWSHH